MSLVYSSVQQSTKCPSFTAPCSSPPNVPRLQLRASVHQMSLVYCSVQQSTKCPSFTAPCSSPPNVPRLQLRAAVHQMSLVYSSVQQSTKCPSFTAPCSQSGPCCFLFDHTVIVTEDRVASMTDAGKDQYFEPFYQPRNLCQMSLIVYFCWLQFRFCVFGGCSFVFCWLSVFFNSWLQFCCCCC